MVENMVTAGTLELNTELILQIMDVSPQNDPLLFYIKASFLNIERTAFRDLTRSLICNIFVYHTLKLSLRRALQRRKR